MPEDENDFCESFRHLIFELRELIDSYQNSQILFDAALDYVTSDHTRVLTPEQEKLRACSLMTFYEDQLKRLNEEYAELDLEISQTLRRYKTAKGRLKPLRKASRHLREDV